VLLAVGVTWVVGVVGAGVLVAVTVFLGAAVGHREDGRRVARAAA
jgi:hypothetical protein